MGVRWTEEQKQVIGVRHGNLLVSAAAGSGKTAVLIEHIFSMISDPEDPVDVTDLLVVTFTNAAAAEMRGRLRKRLDDALEQEPENVHLRRQVSLLDQARICTIDSFCQWAVRTYFHQLDIDPDFRIADSAEDRLLVEDVLEEVMQASYEEAAPDFLHLVDVFGNDGGDEPVRRMVTRLYRFADSAPWPDEWLKRQRDACLLPDDEDEENDAVRRDDVVSGDSGKLPGWILEVAEAAREELSELADRLKDAAAESDAAEGLGPYAEMFRLDERFVRDLAETQDAAEFFRKLGGAKDYYKSARKPTIRTSGKSTFDPEVRNRLSDLRDAVKDRVVKKIQKKYACDPVREDRRLRQTSPDRRALIDLTLRFSESYREEKKRRSLMTFGDIEHLALSLFVVRREGKPEPTPLAGELGRTFREIIVDEYQDSNLVQETILRALSGEQRGEGNMFMVGDVKQSIYKFRMARPELFIGKYRTFGDSPDSPQGRRIDLSRNFRSRPCVVDAVNGLFRQIMQESCGGIEYDDRAALYCGASYPPGDPEPELLLADEESCGGDPAENEALMVAEKIHTLMDPATGMKVFDVKRGEYRPLQYRDIVILLRAPSGWAETMAHVLGQEDIPAYAQLKNGYYSAREVQVLLNFLRILDNPLQDIPLASVLLSPIGGFTGEELAEMTAGIPGGPFFRRLEAGAALGRVNGKWEKFRSRLEHYRKLSSRPIYETLTEILEETDYRRILAVQPNGRIRSANAEMLISMAMAFEETSYHGIFQFLRYIDRLQKYQEDEGEAQVLSENEDLVRITSIHQSKGLEYPVVFVCGCGKKFNDSDSSASMLIHEDLGLACDYTDIRRHVKYQVLWKQYVSDRIQADSRGEELRILYVALTRAKEKLILTGTRKNAEQEARLPKIPDPRPTGRQIRSAGNFLDWIFMAQRAAGKQIFRTRVYTGSELKLPADTRAGKQAGRFEAWLDAAGSPAEDAARVENFREILNYRYPYEAVCMRKGAYSVSELKAAVMHREDESSGISAVQRPVEESETEEETETKGKTGASGGADRGTAYHRALQLISAEDGADETSVERELDRLTEDGQMTEEERKMVRAGDLAAYYGSYLGRIAAEAEKKGKLWREQPFIMSVPLREVVDLERKGRTEEAESGVPDSGTRGTENGEEEEIPEDEWVLVQGIIDCFAETDRGIILWDYKTDRVPRRGGEKILLSRYREQLLLYRDAIQRARGETVAEMWIYSFALRRAVRVDEGEEAGAEKSG